jgi:hypothetical protein
MEMEPEPTSEYLNEVCPYVQPAAWMRNGPRDVCRLTYSLGGACGRSSHLQPLQALAEAPGTQARA